MRYASIIAAILLSAMSLPAQSNMGGQPSTPPFTSLSTLPFIDAFFRAGTGLGTGYTDYINSFDPIGATSVGAQGHSSSNDNLTAYVGFQNSPVSHCISSVNPSTSVSFRVGCALRIQGTPATTANYYECDEFWTGTTVGNVEILKRTGDTPSGGATVTTLTLDSGVTVSAADVLDFRVVGNSLFCTQNGTTIGMEYNDSSSPLTGNGYPGLFMGGNSSGAVIENSFSVRGGFPPASATVNVIVDGDSTCVGSGLTSPLTDYITFRSGQVGFVNNICISGKGLGTSRNASGINGNGSGGSTGCGPSSASACGTLETMLATSTSVIPSLIATGKVNICVLGTLVNDIANGTSAATEYGYLTTYVQNVHTAGCKLVVVMALSDSSHDTAFQEFNVLLAANAAGADAIAVLPPSLTATGAYSNTQFFSDGVHPTQFATTDIMAPAISRAINSLY